MEARNKQIRLNRELETKMKQLKVKEEEIGEVAKLKADLKKQGMDIKTLIKLAKEFSYGSTKG